MSECTHDCSTCGAACSSRQPESLLVKPHEGSHIKKVIGVCSGKGGVGKSLVTSLMAVSSRRMGLKTGILDADITGPSIPKTFGVHKKAEGTDDSILPVTTTTGIDLMSLNLLMEDETDPVVWRGPIIAGAVGQFWTDVVWGDKDVLYIDMPPGTGDVMLTVCQTIPLDGLILVSTPQELVGMIVEKAVKMAQIMNVPLLGLVENMSYVTCPDCSKQIEIFGKSHAQEIAAKYGIPAVAKIPMDPKLSASVDKGMIELFNGSWLDGLADRIYDIVKE